MIPAPMITTSKVREDADITASGRSIRVDIEMEPNKLVLDPKAKLPDCLLGDEKRRSLQGLGYGRNVDVEAEVRTEPENLMGGPANKNFRFSRIFLLKKFIFIVF
jgi:hypothetical protein